MIRATVTAYLTTQTFDISLNKKSEGKWHQGCLVAQKSHQVPRLFPFHRKSVMVFLTGSIFFLSSDTIKTRRKVVHTKRFLLIYLSLLITIVEKLSKSPKSSLASHWSEHDHMPIPKPVIGKGVEDWHSWPGPTVNNAVGVGPTALWNKE